jgi:hypothetical protein
VLRQIALTGQLPLGWGDDGSWQMTLFDLLHLPLSIADQRVRFGAASPLDMQLWVEEFTKESDRNAETRNWTRQGGELLIKWLREQRAQRIDDLRKAA